MYIYSNDIIIIITSYIHARYVFSYMLILGGDDFKCPITCEVMRDPVVASGIDIAYHGEATC